MSSRTFAGKTLEQLRELKLPALVAHSEESVSGAVLEPDVPWYEHLERLDGLQQVVAAFPELIAEIERLNRKLATPGSADSSGSVPAPHLGAARVESN